MYKAVMPDRHCDYGCGCEQSEAGSNWKQDNIFLHYANPDTALYSQHYIFLNLK